MQGGGLAFDSVEWERLRVALLAHDSGHHGKIHQLLRTSAATTELLRTSAAANELLRISAAANPRVRSLFEQHCPTLAHRSSICSRRAWTFHWRAMSRTSSRGTLPSSCHVLRGRAHPLTRCTDSSCQDSHSGR